MQCIEIMDSEEEKDCEILEETHEMKKMKRIYKQENRYRSLGSIENLLEICNHSLSCTKCFRCEYLRKENPLVPIYPTVATMTYFDGPSTGPVALDRIRHRYLCQRHIAELVVITKRKKKEEQFYLIGCTLCSRGELSICSNCFVVFQLPSFSGSVFCPNCEDFDLC